MSNYFHLMKLNFLNTLPSRSKTKKELTILAIAFIFLFLYLFGISTIIFEYTKSFELIIVLLALMLTAVITLFSTINVASSHLFNFKDYDLLRSLPVSKTTLILSRVSFVYLNDLIINIMFLLPVSLAYFNVVKFNLEFFLILLVVVLFLPVVPLIIGSILSIIITYITSFFKSNKFIQIFIYFSFLAIYFYFYYKITNYKVDYTKVTNLLNLITDLINSKYPLAKFYSEALVDRNYVSLFIYIIISLVLLSVFIIVLQKIYAYINSFLKTERRKSKFKYKKESAGQFRALVKKELKKILSSPIYFMNSLLGLIILLAMSIYLLFSSNKTLISSLTNDLNIQNFNHILPIVLSILIGLSCTTHSSISFEGKAIHLIKTMPIKLKTFLDSKIATNLFLNSVVLLISVSIINFVLEIELLIAIYNYLIPLLFTSLIIVIALILNLKFPKFNYTSDAQVVKQSLASFITTMLAMILPIIIVQIVDNVTRVNLSLLIISISLAILLILAYLVLNIYAKKRIKDF